MSRTEQAVDRHYVVPLTDEEHKEVKRRALEANLKIKEWLQVAILEKLYKHKED